LFYEANIGYIVLSLLTLALIKLQRPTFNLQLGIQVGTDIVCIVLMSYASGELPAICRIVAGFAGCSRFDLPWQDHPVFAALASIAVLLEHSYSY